MPVCSLCVRVVEEREWRGRPVLVDNEWIPFTASPDDPEEFGRVLFSEVETTLPPKEESSE